METNNFIAEQLLSGNVTLNLVGICVAVASMAVGITLWAVYRFQSKADANDAEERLLLNLKNDSEGHKKSIEETKANFKMSIDGLHDHMKTMKTETKDDIKQLQAEFSGFRTVLSQMANDLGFIRGKQER